MTIFFRWQVSGSKLQYFSHNATANDIYSKPIKAVFSNHGSQLRKSLRQKLNQLYSFYFIILLQ